MDRDALKRELTKHFEQSLDQAMDAVERAPDGSWIAASEWQVRQAFQKLTAQAFERIVQAKVDAAATAAAGVAFSPCGSARGAAQGKAGIERAQRRRGAAC